MPLGNRTTAVRLAHEVLGNDAVTNSYVIWRSPDNPDDISKVGKVSRYGLLPGFRDHILEFYWVAEKQTMGCPWRLICQSAPDIPHPISGGSGMGVRWSKPSSEFGPSHGLIPVPLGTIVTTMKGFHHVVVSTSKGTEKWEGEDLYQHSLTEYHLEAGTEHLLILQPFHNLYDHERWSLAIVSEVVRHCPLNAWHEGVPYHTHRLEV